jgi:hypothetical protein
MPDTSNSTDYAKPCADSGGEHTVTDIYDEEHGEYAPVDPAEPSGTNPATKLDPSPFTLKG